MTLGSFTMVWAGISLAQESTYHVVKKRGTLVAGVKNDNSLFCVVDAAGKWIGGDCMVPAGPGVGMVLEEAKVKPYRLDV